jgi:hypothetical protein
MNPYAGSLVVISALLLAGCASTGGIAPNRSEISRMRDTDAAEIRAITYAPAGFELLSAKKVAAGSMFGILGAVSSANSMQKAGQEMIIAYSVVDPSIPVREKLAEALTNEFGLKSTVDSATASDDVTVLKSRFGGATILDTKTKNWRLSYYPGDWSHHFLIYSVRARLLRLSDGKVLWEGQCVRKMTDAKNSRRTVDQYRANNGELLKQKVQEAAGGCADELSAGLSAKGTVE